MQEAVPSGEGAMLAVLGIASKELDKILEINKKKKNVVSICYWCPNPGLKQQKNEYTSVCSKKCSGYRVICCR